MTYQHLISHIRLAREIAGTPLTSYEVMCDDPETRTDGTSDPTPDEFLKRLAEVHAGMSTPLTRLRRRRDEGHRDYDVPEIKQGYRRSGVDLNRGDGELNIGTD